MEGDDIILSPSGLTPPPHLGARATRVSLTGGKLVHSLNTQAKGLVSHMADYSHFKDGAAATP